jgi:hypothetical protein
MQHRLAKLTLLTGILLQVSAWQPHFDRYTGSYTRLVVPQQSKTELQYSLSATAMCINSITGKELRAEDIDAAYGYELLRALNTECEPAGFTWHDGGEIRPGWWEFLQHQVEEQRLPVTLALNGRQFCPENRGVIVVVVAVKWDWAKIADPVSGRFRWVTRQQLEAAEQHPHGNWMFYAERFAGAEGSSPQEGMQAAP